MNYLFNKKDFQISKSGLSSIESIEVGGISQYILIQTENIENPVLLVIHGGPSMPVPAVSSRGQDYALITCTKELVKHYTLVFWDQRGTGKSYAKDIQKDTMHLNQFISDANELVDYLRNRFHTDKIHVAAHSWGTVIGLPLVHRYPEKFHSYIAFSQITNWVENDKLCYKWVFEKARADRNQKAINELITVGEPPYLKSFEQWAVLRKWLFKYNSMFYDAGDKRSANFFSGLAIMLKSPDYSLMDVFHSLVSGFKLAYTEQMLYDINHFDFFTEVPELQMPVIFIHGARETHVWPELVQRYYDGLIAPQGKKIFWMNKSAHAFHPDDAKEIEQLLIEHLKCG